MALDAGISQPTAKAWLSVLESTFIAFQLQPYFANIGKRLVKTPKLHFYDTGLVCWLLGIRKPEHLALHPLRGPIFETWVVSEILKHRLNRGEHAGLFFYRDRQGLEADLVIEEGTGLTIIEARAGQTATADLIGAGRGVAALLGSKRPCRRVVVFGGETGQQREDATIVPWDTLDQERW